MKRIYKIGRSYIVSSELFECFKPFEIGDLRCDDQADVFFDAKGKPADRPISFQADRNVLFLDFTMGKPDLARGAIVSSEKDMTVWRIGENWVYSSNYGDSWLEISPDYLHAIYYCGYPDVQGHTTTLDQPILMAVQCSMLMQGYLIIHAAAVETEGKAVLFSAPSGVGKSTRADRWIEAFGASFISGDRPIIDPLRAKAYGAPWDGKEGIHRNVELPIAAFNFISRSDHTKLTRMTEDAKKRALATQAFIPMWDPCLVTRVFMGIRQLIKNVSIWDLACDQTIEAARECHAVLFPKEPESMVELMRQLKASDTPKADYRKYIDQYLDFKARKLGIPLYGTFELTPLCNLDCKMCYVHLNKQQLGNCGLISVERWKSLIKTAHDNGMKLARLTGGECLTYPGFDELYLYLQELGVEITVLTNGVLLDEKRIEFFKKNPLRLIQVTLYGSCDDAYEKVTGVRCFERVYRNIMNAKEAGLPITIAITPNAFAYQDLSNLLELAEKSEIPYNINSILSNPRKNTGRDLHDITVDQYVEIYRLRAQMHHENIQPADPSEIHDPSASGKANKGIKCGAGRSNFTISWDGRMIPCTALSDLYPSKPIKDFMQEWKAVNTWSIELSVPSECDSCVYEPYCVLCIASHYDPEHPGHCNEEICKRSKKLEESGLITL